MAKINVLLFMKDERYCAKISDYFARFYEDEFTFTPAHTRETAAAAYDGSAEPVAPIVLIGEEFAGNAELPADAVTAYLVSSDDTDTADGYFTFNKYQSGAKLRDEILKLYNTALEKRKAAKTPAVTTRLSSLTEITVFTAATGGAGATTCALAYAKRGLKAGIKTLFLSFDYFGKVSLLFSGTGTTGETSADNPGISPLIDAIVESAENDDGRQDFSAVAKPLIQTDYDGIMYVGEAAVPAHLDEITANSAVYALNALLTAATELGACAAVIDVPYLNREFWRVSADLSDLIVVVSEKTSYSDSKFRRFVDTVGIDDILHNTANTHKLKPLRNKVAAGLTLSESARGEVNDVAEIAKVVGARGDFTAIADVVSEANAWNNLFCN